MAVTLLVHFKAFWSRCRVLACEVRTCAKAKYWEIFGVYKWHSSLDFYFSLPLLPSFFALLASLFLSCWAFSRFHFGGKRFRILGLDERKGSWVVEKDFHRNFQVNVTGFFCLFHQCHLPNCAHSGYPWPLKLKTLQAVERTWIRTGGYGRLRAKWVKACYSP